jgi:hypothetical protein
MARFSAKMKYRAMASRESELILMRQLLVDLGIEILELMNMYCDNQVACHIASNPAFRERAKHIEIYYHFICEKLQSKK